ncbi:cyclin-dependent kinase G-2-like [Euphorbia lathyris]|uniref:cyclin-dependent kinase G-2-like n=1 Tax=Euphorbia lathyris TaxID=212925 RepID=UPI00331378A9
MAAGRIDVSRRRVYNGYSNKYFDRCRSEANHVELNQIARHDGSYENGYHVSSSGRRLSCRDEEKKLAELRSGNRLHHSPRLEDGEIPICEGNPSLHVGKKRKFSPIIWDVEKKVAVKNRVVVETATQSSRPPTAENDRVDAGVDKYPIPANQIAGLNLVSDKICLESSSSDVTESEAGSLVNLSPPLPLENHGNGDGEQGPGEEGNFAETRSISMSRWAFESDSPGGACLYDDGVPGEIKSSRGFSAERVGPPCEVLKGDRSRSSGSTERDSSTGTSGVEHFEDELKNDDDMDVGGALDRNDDDDQMDESCNQAEESAAASQGSVDMRQGCRSVYEYERLNEINEGTYGKVYKAKDKRTGEIVALKKMKMDVGGYRNLDYGFPITALREINILLSFHHPSIVNVKEVVMDGLDNVFMVMEYMEHDLKGLMQVMKQPFSTSEVKCLMLQLLGGVKYLHDNWVLHRDLKTSNLLLNNEGELKICDFGMSRLYGSPLKSYTSLVVTLWYRAPELLLGAKKYSTAVDMWSVGCIMAELLAKEPLFTGKNEIDQLTKVFKILGAPSETIWPGFSNLPGAKANFVKQPYNLLRKKFPASSFTGSSVLSDLGFDLLNKLLTYDPEKRLTAEAALNHPWFNEVPLPKSKAFMPTYPPQYARNR